MEAAVGSRHNKGPVPINLSQIDQTEDGPSEVTSVNEKRGFPTKCRPVFLLLLILPLLLVPLFYYTDTAALELISESVSWTSNGLLQVVSQLQETFALVCHWSQEHVGYVFTVSQGGLSDILKDSVEGVSHVLTKSHESFASFSVALSESNAVRYMIANLVGAPALANGLWQRFKESVSSKFKPRESPAGLQQVWPLTKFFSVSFL